MSHHPQGLSYESDSLLVAGIQGLGLYSLLVSTSRPLLPYFRNTVRSIIKKFSQKRTARTLQFTTYRTVYLPPAILSRSTLSAPPSELIGRSLPTCDMEADPILYYMLFPSDPSSLSNPSGLPFMPSPIAARERFLGPEERGRN